MSPNQEESKGEQQKIEELMHEISQRVNNHPNSDEQMEINRSEKLRKHIKFGNKAIMIILNEIHWTRTT